MSGHISLKERIAIIRHARGELRAERRSRPEVEREQHASVAALLRHAAATSPFHRERLAAHAGETELAALPVMGKEDLAESFADIASDRRLTLAGLAEHARAMQGSDPLLFGEYRVLTTGGTSGVATYVPFDRHSWVRALAAYVRLGTTYGFAPRLAPRRRLALITAGGPLHMTNRLATTNESPAYVTLRLDVTAPIGDLVAQLQRFQPDVLSGYPTLVEALAEEQRSGRLSISPRKVICGSEQLTPRVRRSIADTWVDPFDIYATTETGGVLAFECPEHRGLHLREETCVVEVVDEHDRPVEDGQAGSAMLVTSWLNLALPLIRYRVTDPVRVTSNPCPCGRTSRRIVELTGRQEDVVRLPGSGGASVSVHPNHFEETIEERPEVARYQVVHKADAITVSVVARDGGAEGWTDELERALDGRLRRLGGEPPPIHVHVVEELERSNGAGAKLKVIQSLA